MLVDTVRRGLLAIGLAGAAAACAPKATIPGTEIPDTPEHRAVLQTLENYRIAMIQRDPVAVLATVHPTYYDHAGTDDPGDDLTYDRLGPLLRRRLAQLEAVRFTVDYLDVRIEHDRAVVRVWVDASFRLRPPEDAWKEEEGDRARVNAALAREIESRVARRSRYARLQDFNEFELVRDGKTWLITRGI